jgi:hypothetical protein
MKHISIKPIAIKHVALFAALVVSTAASAANYNYTENYSYTRKTSRSGADMNRQLQSDTASCDSVLGTQVGMPSANYRSCMLQRGWRFTHLDRSKAPADPYFSSDAKVAPGHFIDHDNGMDCQNMGGAEVCDPPQGTVHYFDPDQNLPCTRTGAMSICSNM